jgi:hypothetical protein
VVKVLDEDVGQDDLLGMATLKLDNVLDGKEHAVSLDLQAPTGGTAGRVELLVKFHSFAGARTVWHCMAVCKGAFGAEHPAQSIL